MLGWGIQLYQSFSKNRKFLHVIKTYIRAYNLQGTISFGHSRTISTTPDVSLGVRKYSKVMSLDWSTIQFLIIFMVLLTEMCF